MGEDEAMRINELRNKSEKEQSNFRIEDANGDALQKSFLVVFGNRDTSRIKRLISIQNSFDADIN